MYDWRKIPLPENRAEVAYKLIKDYLLSGEVEWGARITQTYLEEKMGISKTPIREALKRLEREGLIRIVPNKGAIVIRFNLEEVEELFGVFEYLEALAVRNVTRHVDETLLRSLSANLEEARSYIDSDDNLSKAVQLDLAFHEEVVKASGNKKLLELYSIINAQLHVLYSRLALFPEDLMLFTEQHREIIKAIANADCDAAERISRSHIVNTKEVILRRFREMGPVAHINQHLLYG